MHKRQDRYTFGLLIDWIVGWEDTDYYQSLIISGLSDFAKEHDINIMCFVTGRVMAPTEWERSRNLLFQFIDSKKLDGLIVPTPSIGLYSNPSAVVELIKGYTDIPIVTLGESHDGYHSVTINNYSGMRQIVEHLIKEHQHRRIAFITGSDCKESSLRFKAYCDALEAHGIDYDPQLVYKGNFLFVSGVQAVKSFKKNNIPYDALVCSNDNMAMGALIEFTQNHSNDRFNLPITGFDDVENSKLYALTTVRQCFYDETKRAAQMLLDILEGEETPLHVEIPSEVVLRSSCGCISSRVRNAYTNPIQRKASDSFDDVCSKILDRFHQLNLTLGFGDNPMLIGELLSYEETLLSAFSEEYRNNKKDQFIYAWKSLIFWTIQRKINFTFAHEILSIIRDGIIQSIQEREAIVHAENIFHAARVYLFDALQRTGRCNFNPLQNESSDFLGEELMASLDYTSQMRSMCQVLPRLGIETCYIALFEDPDEPLAQSRLILGLNKQECYNQGSAGQVFRTTDLLPDAFLDTLYSDRFNIVVQVLYQGDNRLGYVILSFEDGINKNYEIIRYRLSVSLKSTLLIDRITKQALSLEKQVIERTKELSESNISLMEEITKRKAVEEQLKKALKDLGYYNEQLRLQSIRDDMTQLYNRRGFMKLGIDCFERAKSDLQGILLLYVDLDGLKRINDQYGHDEGDFAIMQAAEILMKAFRSTDIICRLGGDEFTILIAGATPKDEADIRTRLKNYCDCVNQSLKKPYQISMSVGASYFNPGSEIGFEDLMKLADIALYSEKQIKRTAQLP